MNKAATVARILLGLVFFAAGTSGFVMFSHPPAAPPGLAGAFQDVFFRSGWVLFVDSVELIAGAFLLTNRFVPLALALLAAVLSNILVFHLSMAPAGLPVPLVLVVLWAFVARRYWSLFAPLFVAKPELATTPAAANERVRTKSAWAA